MQPTGPVTIIGETWNSPVAIELALLVQGAERKVELFLIEGDPQTWKKCIESLGNIHSGVFDDNYLQTVLPFKDKVRVCYPFLYCVSYSIPKYD